MAIGRLAADTSITQTRAELGAITRRLALQYPDTNRDRAALITPLKDTLLGNLPSTLWMLAAARVGGSLFIRS